ncbi:DUF6920 family protein [Salipaludibacillus aurantiacus]|uniref:Uncharacterized protein n=1 Tax=Salipaludibacillus aurantiacus TaxID=1601833 RepID=A0A1H9VZU1_9BACI|nr:DUF6544 family protein [Salipaludibacillus aurantiacus]SES27084.1 hypothetical protein SAMN05518684_11392 [Salipaludibacillus aurantiacus]
MKIALLIIIVIHGLIHLLGFLKGFNLLQLSELSISISRGQALVWMGTGIVLIISSVLLLINSDHWWKVGIAAVIVSQILIVMTWGDAKAGAAANIIIGAAIIFAYADSSLNTAIEKEIVDLTRKSTGSTQVISEDMMEDLPQSVQRWISNSGAVGKEIHSTMDFKHYAKLKLKPDQKEWYNAKAHQYVTTEEPGFLWKIDMEMNPFITVKGRDLYKNGKGSMQMKLASLVSVANVENDDKIDQSTLQRYLLEMAWYPWAALSPYITWEELGDHSARATMNYKGATGTADFFFNEDGDFFSSRAWRYDGSTDSYLECIGKANEFSVINGVKIPTDIDVSYVLDDDIFTWYKVSIYDIKF